MHTTTITNLETLKRKAYFLEVVNSFSSELLKVNTVHDTVWAIAKHAIAKLGYIDCVVYLVSESRTHLLQSAAHGPKSPKVYHIDNPIVLEIGKGICGYVAQTGKSVIISDTSKDERYQVDDSNRLSEIAVPIFSNNEVIGVIDSEHPEKNHFTDQDIEILETIASMVSVKIGQAKALEEIERHKVDLERRVQSSTLALQQTIEKLQASNELIKKSNTEKETLLKEIHHRVKNNLQIVSSLLNLHSGQTDNNKEKDVLRDCQRRIKSMSLIHEQLYNKENLAEIDAKKYIEEITYDLSESMDSSNNISIELNLDPVVFDIDISVPFGLILNELVVNCFKHAFPDCIGIIQISLSNVNQKIRLIVQDNGIGFEKNKEHDSLGLELIDTLTEQLEGELSFESSNKGTKCQVLFELPKNDN